MGLLSDKEVSYIEGQDTKSSNPVDTNIALNRGVTLCQGANQGDTESRFPVKNGPYPEIP